MKNKYLNTITLLFLSFALFGCFKENNLRDSLIGTWVSIDKDGKEDNGVEMTFIKNGTGLLMLAEVNRAVPCSWVLIDDKITIDSAEFGTVVTNSKVSFTGDTLTIYEPNSSSYYKRK